MTGSDWVGSILYGAASTIYTQTDVTTGRKSDDVATHNATHRSDPGVEHILQAGGAGQHGAGAQDCQDARDSCLLLDGAA
jgi:hypothetical protein